MEPILRPADVLQCLVLPTLRLHAAGVRRSGSTLAAGDDSEDERDAGAGPGDLRLALLLGLDVMPAVGDGCANVSRRSNLATTPATAKAAQAVASTIDHDLAAEGVAGKLMQALCGLLEARLAAMPGGHTAAVADRTSAAEHGEMPVIHVPLRLIELAMDLLQRLVSATAEYSAAVSCQRGVGANVHPGGAASAGYTQLDRQLGRLLVAARGCSWRTLLQLAPLESAMRGEVSSFGTAPAVREQFGPSGSFVGLATLLCPPILLGSRGGEHVNELSCQASHARLLPSDTSKIKQAITECLVLCASSADAATAFAEAATAVAVRQMSAVAGTDNTPSAVGTAGVSKLQRQTMALSELVLSLPRQSARRLLLAACLELLPWSTAAEYQRLTETVLSAWLATLQPRGGIASHATACEHA